jgi:hypothetical protein
VGTLAFNNRSGTGTLVGGKEVQSIKLPRTLPMILQNVTRTSPKGRVCRESKISSRRYLQRLAREPSTRGKQSHSSKSSSNRRPRMAVWLRNQNECRW